MNADGKFIENDTYSERQKDCIIFDASGNEVNRDAAGEYQLSSGQEYYLEKDIPGDYRGMLTWKLELTQTTNAYIRLYQEQLVMTVYRLLRYFRLWEIIMNGAVTFFLLHIEEQYETRFYRVFRIMRT